MPIASFKNTIDDFSPKFVSTSKSMAVSKRGDASSNEAISIMLSGEAGLHSKVFSNCKPASPGEAISNCEATVRISQAVRLPQTMKLH